MINDDEIITMVNKVLSKKGGTCYTHLVVSVSIGLRSRLINYTDLNRIASYELSEIVLLAYIKSKPFESWTTILDDSNILANELTKCVLTFDYNRFLKNKTVQFNAY